MSDLNAHLQAVAEAGTAAAEAMLKLHTALEALADAAGVADLTTEDRAALAHAPKAMAALFGKDHPIFAAARLCAARAQ
jgi:hypothetical protein